MNIGEYILENRLILIPVLIVIGWFIKHTQAITNKWIPLILLVTGVLLSVMIDWRFSVDAVIQGILTAGAAVLGDQIPKQLRKDE